MPQKQKTLAPSIAQRLIATETFGQTLASQTELPVTQPSPATLTFASPQNGKIHVAVRIAANETVASVVDDANNTYSLILVPTIPNTSDRWEVWEATNVAEMNGTVITTTNGGDVIWAMLSSINPPPSYSVAQALPVVAEPPVKV